MDISLESLAEKVEALERELKRVKRHISADKPSLHARTKMTKRWMKSLPPIDENSCLHRLRGSLEGAEDLSDKHKHGF